MEKVKDTVYRQDAIDAVISLCDDCDSDHCGSCRVNFDGVKDVRKVLKDLPSARQWIPCNERLPYAEYGEGDNVLATCGYRNVEDESIRWIRTLCFNGGNWCYPTGETYLEKVYAWMPLPELYKERLEE